MQRIWSRREFLRQAGLASASLALGPSVRALAQEREIRVGALVPLTGLGGAYGPGMLRAIELGVEEINAAGGPLGLPIRLFSADTQTSPEAAVLAVKKLLDINRVMAVLGTWSSGVTMAVVPITIDAGVIEMNVSGAPQISTLEDRDLVWRTQASNTLFGVAFARIALERNFKRAATMAFNNPSGLGNTREFARNFRAAGGQVVAEVVYNPDQPSYRAELQRVLVARPEVVVMGSYVADTTTILREAYEMGARVSWIAPAWAVNEQLLRALDPAVVEGVVAVDQYPNVNSPTYRRLDERFRKATGGSLIDNPYAPMVYDQIQLLALAIQAARTTEPLKVAPFLREVSRPPGQVVYSFAEGKPLLEAGQPVDYEGASSRIDFDEHGDVRPDFAVFQVRQGRRELVGVIRLGGS